MNHNGLLPYPGPNRALDARPLPGLLPPPPPTSPRPLPDSGRPRHLRDLLQWLDNLVGDGGPEPEQYDRLTACFRELARQRHQLPYGPGLVQDTRAVLAPTLLKGTLLGFLYLRPHGYPGDFELLERVLSYHHSTDPNLVRWDAYCHTLPMVRALRGRAAHLRAQLERLEPTEDPGPVRVLHFRSGPGREFADYFIARGGDTKLRGDCVDPDPAAVLHGRRTVARMTDRVTFHHAPLLRFQSPTPYRLIWLSSLCEMIDDRALSLVLRRLLRRLEPGGRLVLCQLSRPDATAAILDLIADWRLQYRDASALERIALDAGIDSGALRVMEEAASSNLFLHLQRPAEATKARSRRAPSEFRASTLSRARRPVAPRVLAEAGRNSALRVLPPADLPTAA